MAKPKAVPYLTVGFGTRPQRLKLPPGVTEPPKQVTPNTKPVGVTQSARPAGAVTSSRLPLGNAPAGRPPSNLGRYLLRPDPGEFSGYEMLNTKPDAISEMERKLLMTKQLPAGLRPQGLAYPQYAKRPAVLETGRKKAISRGFRKPRSLQG